MTQCLTHWDKLASGVCAGCGEPFCPDCLVTLSDKAYCASCKVAFAPSMVAPPALPFTGRKSEKAGSALVCAIIGLFVCAPILAPIALVHASGALKEIGAAPGMEGSGKAKAARAIAIVSLVIHGLLLMVRLASLGRS